MSDTPRTDAWLHDGHAHYMMGEHCRQLERELAAAKARAAHLDKLFHTFRHDVAEAAYGQGWGSGKTQQEIIDRISAEKARAEAAETDASLTADQNNLLLQTLKERCCERDDLEAQVKDLTAQFTPNGALARENEQLAAQVATLREALVSAKTKLYWLHADEGTTGAKIDAALAATEGKS